TFGRRPSRHAAYSIHRQRSRPPHRRPFFRWGLWPGQGCAEVTGKPQRLDGPRILVVDDNEDNRYTLKLHLDLEGYRNIVAAQDGEEALARLERGQFDLVLLDVVMPKVDGYEVLKRLKAQGKLHEIPVIMISA